ncbi:hypothetical protein BDP55DRAFT_774560 [Colletotrichum godetiae]|uniref:Uncharacterized protein n=1 Tax=Colletotrichum godetiae TaxID=1209918 RepID=A0AAJ0A4W2_9PEZI|nr:uncharacterized protein BDP55DRAFT_774560 [Colletotrichum godetiae]KAK1656533.1 hypothetical protein BDP55DRAFT_774560 [Colletotrichum godetiae]
MFPLGNGVSDLANHNVYTTCSRIRSGVTKPVRHHVWSELYNGAEGLPPGPNTDKRRPPPNHGDTQHWQAQAIPAVFTWIDANCKISMSLMRSVLELLDMVACAIVEIDTAADIIESKNATYKTAVWLVDQLGLEVNGLAVAVEAMAVDTIAPLRCLGMGELDWLDDRNGSKHASGSWYFISCISDRNKASPHKHQTGHMPTSEHAVPFFFMINWCTVVRLMGASA